MNAQRFTNLLTNPVDGRERTHRFLEDHGNFLATNITDFLATRVKLGEINRIAFPFLQG